MRLFAACLIVVSWTAGPARAQESAVAELLRRVPDDLGLCLVVNDLRGHIEAWRSEPWFRRLKGNPIAQAILASKEAGDLARLEADIKKYIGVDVATVRDEVLGDGIVFAFQPAGPGRTEKGI